MKMRLDPITTQVERFAWVFWTILWVSLATGLGQEETMFLSGGDLEVLEGFTILVVALMWLAVVLQTIRQLFYSKTGVLLVRIGRWLLLGSSSIFAFRTTWMLVVHGTEMHISPATLFGGGLLAIGLSFNALGRMQQSYTYDTDEEESKHLNKWILGENVSELY
jgi:hypothetical protein